MIVPAHVVVTPDSTQMRQALIFCGAGRTDSHGHRLIEIPVGDLGPTEGLAFLSVVATPVQHGNLDVEPRPAYLVAKLDGNSIAVWSFAADGEWLPSVEFMWICVAQVAEVQLTNS